MVSIRYILIVGLSILTWANSICSQTFTLFTKGESTSVFVSEKENSVVKMAVSLFSEDMKNVFDIVLIVKKILEIVFIFEERIFVRGV